MTYFVKMTWQGKPGYSQYDGMDQAAIMQTLTAVGATDVSFISEEEFRIGAAKPAPVR